MGRRTRKSVAALAGRLPACDPARPRSAGAGFGSEGRRRAAWNRTWAPGLPDMGCDLSAIAGALARVTSGRRVEDGGAFPSRGAATLIGTASPVPLAADVRTRSLAVRLFVARNGYGAARHVRLLMCDKEAIEVQKILPFLSDTWPFCRIGRAVIRASQSCRQSCNKSQCPACGCRSHHSCTHAPQFSRSFPAREWGSVLQRQGACGQCP